MNVESRTARTLRPKALLGVGSGVESARFRWWLRKLVSVFIIALLTTPLGFFPPIRNASALLWDTVEALGHRHIQVDRQQVDRDVAVLVVTEDDYDYLFDRRSPLDRDRLAELIARILESTPRALVVDILTDHHSYAGLRDAVLARVDPSQRAEGEIPI